MMTDKKIPELRFDENTDGWSLHESASEELCTNGQPHDFKGWREDADGRGGTSVCTRCGLTAFEHSMRYGI